MRSFLPPAVVLCASVLACQGPVREFPADGTGGSAATGTTSTLTTTTTTSGAGGDNGSTSSSTSVTGGSGPGQGGAGQGVGGAGGTGQGGSGQGGSGQGAGGAGGTGQGGEGGGPCSSACPDGFACNGDTGCLTSCARPTDCVPGFECAVEPGTCSRIQESDCLDGIDNSGDGLADCADPTCEPVVECVPEAPTGGELGVHVTDGVCPTDYDADTQVFHTGLMPQACTGCSCVTTCSATVQLWTDLDCTAGQSNQAFTGPADASTQCRNVTNTPFKSGTLTAPSIAGCTAGGTATQPDPTWATDDTFCSAQISSSCGSGETCVAKRETEPLCTRIGVGDACPSDYDTTDGVYYAGFVPGGCGSCTTCNAATTMSCKAAAFMPLIYDTAGCTGGASIIDTSGCGSLNRPSYRSISMGFDNEGPDNCTPNVTRTDPTVSGATRICCQ